MDEAEAYQLFDTMFDNEIYPITGMTIKEAKELDPVGYEKHFRDWLETEGIVIDDRKDYLDEDLDDYLKS